MDTHAVMAQRSFLAQVATFEFQRDAMIVTFFRRAGSYHVNSKPDDVSAALVHSKHKGVPVEVTLDGDRVVDAITR